SIPCIFRSSTKLPRPRTRRSDSLSGSDWPTHGPDAAFFAWDRFCKIVSPLPVRVAGCLSAVLGERCAQPLDQFLEVLFGQGLEQPSGYRNQPAEQLCVALPGNARTSVRLLQVEPCRQVHGAAGHASLAPINGGHRRAGLLEMKVDIGGAANVGNTHF